MSEASLVILSRLVDELNKFNALVQWDNEERLWSIAGTQQEVSDALAPVVEVKKLARKFLSDLVSTGIPEAPYPPRLWPPKPMDKKTWAEWKAKRGMS